MKRLLFVSFFAVALCFVPSEQARGQTSSASTCKLTPFQTARTAKIELKYWKPDHLDRRSDNALGDSTKSVIANFLNQRGLAIVEKKADITVRIFGMGEDTRYQDYKKMTGVPETVTIAMGASVSASVSFKVRGADEIFRRIEGNQSQSFGTLPITLVQMDKVKTGDRLLWDAQDEYREKLVDWLRWIRIGMLDDKCRYPELNL